MKNIFKNHFVKYILQALAVAIFGFILLNIAFLFDWVFHIVVIYILKLLIPADVLNNLPWFPPLMHVLFMIIICITSWYIFRSKLGDFYKAVFITVPLAVVFVTLGILFYRWPIVPFALSGLIVVALIVYFSRTKQSWLYYYAVVIVAAVLALFTLFGGQM